MIDGCGKLINSANTELIKMKSMMNCTSIWGNESRDDCILKFRSDKFDFRKLLDLKIPKLVSRNSIYLNVEIRIY